MHGKLMFIVILAITAALVLLIGILLCASIVRRFYHDRKYRELDLLRDAFSKKIRALLESGSTERARQEFSAPPKSAAWEAIEDVLLILMNEKIHKDEIKHLLVNLGYVAYYEKQSMKKNVQDRALSIDKLGKMQSATSIQELIPLLDNKEREIVSVTIRSLSKIGGQGALNAIVDRLPVLLNNALVTGKALETDLLAFGPDVIPALVGHSGAHDNPRVAASVLEILSRLPSTPGSVHLAIEHLAAENAEVRSRALKVLGRAEHAPEYDDLPERIIPLLDDPAWYVRLQAIRSLRTLTCERGVSALKKRLFDEQWQVRNEAARALIMLGECSLDVLLEVLTGSDEYAKYSICEEIEHTNFCAQLLEHLGSADALIREKCGRIVETMYALGFATPLEAYLEQGTNDIIKQRLRVHMVRSVSL